MSGADKTSWPEEPQTLTMTCRQCGEPFSLTADERAWYVDRHYNLPRRCRTCRTESKGRTYSYTCAKCGSAFSSPWYFAPERSPLCEVCYSHERQAQAFEAHNRNRVRP